jgi:hypothetical protein
MSTLKDKERMIENEIRSDNPYAGSIHEWTKTYENTHWLHTHKEDAMRLIMITLSDLKPRNINQLLQSHDIKEEIRFLRENYYRHYLFYYFIILF